MVDTNNPKEVKHWANQVLLLIRGFVTYLEAVEATGTMYPDVPHHENAWSHAERFYGDNGTLCWIDDALLGYCSHNYHKRADAIHERGVMELTKSAGLK